jgi:membrane protein implicated in regulation of membrane protease activity
MTWWLWILLGLVLSALELATPGGFYLIFFGVGALFTGLVSLLDFGVPGWAEWIVFAVASVVMLLVFRRPILRMMQPAMPDVDSLVGEIATTMDAIPAGQVGRAELRGTAWSARNGHGLELARGQRCRVERVDGLTLYLVPER